MASRARLLVVVLATFAAAACADPSDYGGGPWPLDPDLDPICTSGSRDTEILRVAFFNLHALEPVDETRDWDTLARILSLYDVVGLCEVDTLDTLDALIHAITVRGDPEEWKPVERIS